MALKVTEVDLFIGCPACPASDKNSPRFWTHRGCGKRRTITNQGYIGCRNVHGDKTCKEKKFMDCTWSCSQHQHTYKKADEKFAVAHLTRAISRVGKMMMRSKEKELTDAELDCLAAALEKIVDQLG